MSGSERNGVCEYKSVNELDKSHQELVHASVEARNRAYCPYSNFSVGAAIRTKSGEVFQGCNVENASYPLTVCAERVAIGTAVYSGHREITAIAVCCGDAASSHKWPCGACRQVIAEFCEDCTILAVRPDLSVQVATIKHLLPNSFGPRDLLGDDAPKMG